MFFFGPLHVLFIYGLKRVGDIFARDEALFEEIQRRAAKFPPAQRQAAIDSMKNNKAFEREVFLQEQEKIRVAASRSRLFWFIWWAHIIALYFIFDFDVVGCVIFAEAMILVVRLAFI